MALTADRNTPAREATRRQFNVLAAVKIFAGALVMIDANGRAAPGATATAKKGVGRAAALADNSAGANDAIKADVDVGVFRFKNSSAGDAIAQADIGATCYIVDDETVAKTDGTGTRSAAGIVFDVDSLGVWVKFA